MRFPTDHGRNDVGIQRLLFLMFPLVLLYEFGIFLSAGVYRRRAKAEAAYEASLDPPDGSVQKL